MPQWRSLVFITRPRSILLLSICRFLVIPFCLIALFAQKSALHDSSPGNGFASEWFACILVFIFAWSNGYTAALAYVRCSALSVGRYGLTSFWLMWRQNDHCRSGGAL